MHRDTVPLKVLPALNSNARPQNKGGVRQVLFPILICYIQKCIAHAHEYRWSMDSGFLLNLSRLSQIQYTNFLQIVICTKFSNPSPQYGHWYILFKKWMTAVMHLLIYHRYATPLLLCKHCSQEHPIAHFVLDWLFQTIFLLPHHFHGHTWQEYIDQYSPDQSMVNLQNSYCINPLHPKTSFHILHTPINQFSLLLTKRIHLTIKATKVHDNSLYSHDFNEWFSRIMVRRN